MEISKQTEKEKFMQQEKYAFILSWTAVIWRRIWRCSIIYSEYFNIPINTDIILKCLKYNLLSPTGIVEEILPSLEKALTQGFLMPKEYEKNNYVKNAIKLFGEAYRISRLEKGEKEFIKNYASEFVDENENENELIKDKKEFCQLVDSWNIELGLYEFTDNLRPILLYSLLKILDEK